MLEDITKLAIGTGTIYTLINAMAYCNCVRDTIEEWPDASWRDQMSMGFERYKIMSSTKAFNVVEAAFIVPLYINYFLN